MTLGRRLDRLSVRRSDAVEVWYQDRDDGDTYTLRDGVTLTAAQLDARPYEGTRILVTFVDAPLPAHLTEPAADRLLPEVES